MFEKIILSIYVELKYQLCSTHYFSNTAKKSDAGEKMALKYTL